MMRADTELIIEGSKIALRSCAAAGSEVGKLSAGHGANNRLNIEVEARVATGVSHLLW